MWVGALFAVLAMVMFGGYWYIFGQDARDELKEGQANSLAQNMLVFHTAATAYARANPAAISATNGSVTTAQIGRSTTTPPRSSPLEFATGGVSHLPDWYVPAGSWQVAWGKDPNNMASPTIRIVATYLPPVSGNNFNSADIAIGLASVTGANGSAGIATSTGRVAVPSLSGGASAAAQLWLPVSDPGGVQLVPAGSAVVVSQVP